MKYAKRNKTLLFVTLLFLVPLGCGREDPPRHFVFGRVEYGGKRFVINFAVEEQQGHLDKSPMIIYPDDIPESDKPAVYRSFEGKEAWAIWKGKELYGNLPSGSVQLYSPKNGTFTELSQQWDERCVKDQAFRRSFVHGLLAKKL